MIELIGAICIFIGSIIVLAGSLGLIRFPDFFCRLHAASVIDTLGAGFVVIGLLCLSGFSLAFFKVLMIAILIFLLSPVTSHALANAAVKSGLTGEKDKPEDNR